jgi:SAM-dependent methyltransferase
MIKYCATAAALKVFSCSRPTRSLYRGLGNSLGGKRRAADAMPTYYFSRVERMLRLSSLCGVPRDGSQILELGTGWLHWEAITTRLFFDVGGVLYDVWDNRQMNGLKSYLAQLGSMLDDLDIDSVRVARAKTLIGEIQQTTDYRELYALLGFKYVVDAGGVLNGLGKESFDLVVSAGVLEHVYAKDTERLIRGISTVLRPGGYSFHSINIRDHLYQYDQTVSPKQYLRYSNLTWKLFFENDVQYINKMQRSDWLRLFQAAGLTLIEEQIDSVDLSGVKVAKPYQKYGSRDLTCGGLSIVHQKKK